jgi:hypothetical protein
LAFGTVPNALEVAAIPAYDANELAMINSSTPRDAWLPQSKEDHEAVLRELEEIAASQHFCHSKRYPALLQYLVENTLAGRTDLLKERTLGVEVFDRALTYDTNSDTVVRYTAGEVRKRLLLYYSEEGRNAKIRIVLPAGSYVPEFFYGESEANEPVEIPEKGTISHDNAEIDLEPMAREATDSPKSPANVEEITAASLSKASTELSRSSGLWVWATILLFMVACGTGAALVWKYEKTPVSANNAVESFWAPMLHSQSSVLVCTGGVVFDKNNFSGVMTAGKDIDYPFVSMQNASAISIVSGTLERSGALIQLAFAGSEPLTELREHPVVLIGAYNNYWTMHLLQSLRFHFPPEPLEAIVDQKQPYTQWARDRSIPYSSADDYALIARYRDPTINSWVIVVAGLGRNGTEAAAQFATSNLYLQLLRQRIGKDFGSHNLEAILALRVIDGKTGAPALKDVYVW